MKPSAKPNFNFSKTSTGRPEKPAAAAAATHAIASTKTNEKSKLYIMWVSCSFLGRIFRTSVNGVLFCNVGVLNL